MSPSGLDLSEPKPFKMPGFSVIGHRGNGMNVLQSSDRRTRGFKENSILSFNSAAKFPIDFIEFDVQVTKDDCPVIFHDDFIYSQENGIVNESRVTDLSLSEFLLYGPQKEAEKTGKTLMRKSKEGQVLKWEVDSDDPLCTLQEAFERVEHSLGFNIELKFDNQVVYEREFLVHVLRTVLQVVFDYAQDRPVIFSSFQPDAAQLVRELQNTYPVFFLTNAGNQMLIKCSKTREETHWKKPLKFAWKESYKVLFQRLKEFSETHQPLPRSKNLTFLFSHTANSTMWERLCTCNM
uniref:glycerophosphodiester phosphodiesterase n=1 Tax=Brassica oleracea var. oleracea TaxID=109376 RepID=A0A0D3CT71_BRAOL